MKLKYHAKSKMKLNSFEEEYLVGYLSKNWKKGLSYPIIVDQGYDFYIHNDDYLKIGKAKIYENFAKEKLTKFNNKKLRGLYFPFATPSVELLCQATLYFDEIYIIHPGSGVLSSQNQRYPYGEKDIEAAKRYMMKYNNFTNRLAEFDRISYDLKSEEILHAIPPQMQNDPHFIEYITSDLRNEEFIKIADKEWTEPVFIAAKKMEPILPLIGDSIDFKNIKEELDFRANYANLHSKDSKELFMPKAFGVKEVNPRLAASILINHAYLLSDKYNLIPFTDNDLSIRLLNSKLKKMSEMDGFVDYKKQIDLTSSTLAIKVLEEYLPNFKFKNISDALEARYKLKDQLEEFRYSMNVFASEITESQFDSNFLLKVENTISSKVRPAVKELELKIRKSKDDFINKCIGNIKTSSIPIAASIFAGLPAEAVIAISAGVLTFSAAFETYNEIKRNKSNGLTFLLKK